MTEQPNTGTKQMKQVIIWIMVRTGWRLPHIDLKELNNEANRELRLNLKVKDPLAW